MRAFPAMNALRLALLGAFACFSLLAVGCGLRQTTEEDVAAIRRNLSLYHSSGMQFILEAGKNEACYGDIVGEGRCIASIHPVNGEDYTDLVVRPDTRSLSVRAADGREVTWTAPR